MKNKLQSIKYLNTEPVKLIILLLLFSLPFIGSDCNDNVIGGKPGNIVGTWRLVYIGGYLQDICPGEVVTFGSNGVATLQCPNSSPITRNYSVSNNVLTYSPTNVQYRITELQETILTLTGINVGRTLTYNKIPADYPADGNLTKAAGKNSSE